jgi:hypothetical protein
MPLSLAGHFLLIEEEYAAARAALLSARQAKLVAVLLDRFTDRVFLQFRAGAPERVFFAEDAPAYRDALRSASPALATVFDLCLLPPGPVRLATKPVEVPIPEYQNLAVEDFMVSLYNGNSVQRVVIERPDGPDRLVHDVLAEAIDWWRSAGPFD